jgi:hypothetical protein
LSNLWPALNLLLKVAHPEELVQPVDDGHDHEVNSERQGLAIGIISACGNLG